MLCHVLLLTCFSLQGLDVRGTIFSRKQAEEWSKPVVVVFADPDLPQSTTKIK